MASLPGIEPGQSLGPKPNVLPITPERNKLMAPAAGLEPAIL